MVVVVFIFFPAPQITIKPDCQIGENTKECCVCFCGKCVGCGYVNPIYQYLCCSPPDFYN